MGGDELLFTYGTLQRPEVQLDTFGRLLEGSPAALPGYTIVYEDIRDRRLVDASEPTRHPILRRTGNPLDKAVGVVARVTLIELEAADEFEATLYRRIRVTLADGSAAWVYAG